MAFMQLINSITSNSRLFLEIWTIRDPNGYGSATWLYVQFWHSNINYSDNLEKVICGRKSMCTYNSFPYFYKYYWIFEHKTSSKYVKGFATQDFGKKLPKHGAYDYITLTWWNVPLNCYRSSAILFQKVSRPSLQYLEIGACHINNIGTPLLSV